MKAPVNPPLSKERMVAVSAQWRRFVAGMPVDEAIMRPVILQSWQRCRQAGFRADTLALCPIDAAPPLIGAITPSFSCSATAVPASQQAIKTASITRTGSRHFICLTYVETRRRWVDLPRLTGKSTTNRAPCGRLSYMRITP